MNEPLGLHHFKHSVNHYDGRPAGHLISILTCRMSKC